MRVLSPENIVSVEDAVQKAGSAREEFERHETFDTHSLLILERIDDADSEDAKTAENKTRIAQLVRNDELRTPGTTKNTAGNGGRLMIDLGDWNKGNGCELKDVETFIIASCIGMLKKEVDRMRGNQVAMIAAAT
ncbi:hypothetical protein BX600DRAFT_551984 [Xylariales sp. PMI_506]|nr:hypothetical protein BX600DRAFT_551984 [Xylariales sp. PMI_506]